MHKFTLVNVSFENYTVDYTVSDVESVVGLDRPEPLRLCDVRVMFSTGQQFRHTF